MSLEGGEGDTVPGFAAGGVDFSSFLKDLKGLCGTLEPDEVVPVANEQGCVGGVRGELGLVELVGVSVFAGVGQDLGEHLGNGGVVGMLLVEALKQRQGIGLVLGDEDGGELGGEGRVVRGFGEGGAEEGFRVGVFLLGDEQMGKAGDGFGISGGELEDATPGSFCGSGVAGQFGQLGGKYCVLRGFRGDFEGFDEVLRGGCGVWFAADSWESGLDLGERAPCAGLGWGARFAGIEGGGFFELGLGQVGVAGAGEEKAERDLCIEVPGVGFEGAAVEGGGIVGAGLCVCDVGGVEEGTGVGGAGGEPGVEKRLGGFPVGLRHGGFGLVEVGGFGRWGHGGGLRWERSGGGGVLSSKRARDEQEGEGDDADWEEFLHE